MKIWCVWSESGEYEQFSRDLRGMFVTRELAESHASRLKADKVEVVEGEVLNALPAQVPFVRYASHILPDGTEARGSGYHRGSEWQTWSHELKPVDSVRTGPWSRPTEPDLYIEVIGSDEGLVAAEYSRLFAEARKALNSE